MIEIFGTTYYTSWIAATLFCFISLIVFFVLLLVSAKSRSSKRKLVAIFVVLELGIFGIVYWDIIVAGHQVSNMCHEQGGLHVYNTVEADGMAGIAGIKGWDEYGFSYVEYVDSRGYIIRSTMNNGKIIKERVDRMTSQYIRITKRENVGRLIEKSFIKRISHSVVDRINGDLLGELIYFTIQQGWADHWVPGEYTPWQCGNKELRNGHTFYLTVSTLIKGVVEPSRK